MLHFFDRYGSAERVYRLEFVSNSDFNDSEFSKWKETVMLQGLSLPTTYRVEQKLKEIKQALDYKFNEEDVEMVGMFGLKIIILALSTSNRYCTSLLLWLIFLPVT